MSFELIAGLESFITKLTFESIGMFIPMVNQSTTIWILLWTSITFKRQLGYLSPFHRLFTTMIFKVIVSLESLLASVAFKFVRMKNPVTFQRVFCRVPGKLVENSSYNALVFLPSITNLKIKKSSKIFITRAFKV